MRPNATKEQRANILQYHLNNPNASQKQIALSFDVCDNCVGRIIDEYYKYLRPGYIVVQSKMNAL